MSEQLDQPRQPSGAGSGFKRIRHLGNIFMILLCGLVATIEIVEALPGSSVDSPNSDFSGRIKRVIEEQLVKVDNVDPMQLASSFEGSLLGHNCKWIVSCEAIEKDSHAKIHTLDPPGTNLAESLKSSPKPAPLPPKLLTQFLGFPVPTWHSISGAPRAAYDSAKQIGGAGPWAITMFLSCTIIWFVVLFMAANGDNNGMIVYAMVVGCPLGISLMVWCVQHLCEAALHLGLLGCAITVGIIGALHSVALVLAVGFRHIMKTPKELAEEVKELRSV
jgi:hypothetical protein